MFSLTPVQQVELIDIYVMMWSFIWFASLLHIIIFGNGWFNILFCVYGSWIIYRRLRLLKKLDNIIG